MAMTSFKNQILPDFTNLIELEKVKKAITTGFAKVRKETREDFPLIIDGQDVTGEKFFNSENPSNTSEILGKFAKATQVQAEKAMEAATAAFTTWSRKTHTERGRYLLKMAQIMKERRFELSACMVLEEGKTWIEAIADTDEAIDFLDFYGRELAKFDLPYELTRLPREDNDIYYIPLGVGVIIPPWNFPLAILAGMTTAAFGSGNTVILKPASPSPRIAWMFMEIVREARVPDGVVNFLPGSGSEIGDFLVQHHKTRFVCFTGSKEIGLRINELAAQQNPQQIWIKRVILEMGGNDLIIIDEDCDVEKAIQDSWASAIGFSGQKCSALSRLITVGGKKQHAKLVEMFAEKLKKTVLGNPEKLGIEMGPIINEGSIKRMEAGVRCGKACQARLVTGGKRLTDGDFEKGYFWAPTLWDEVDPYCELAQEEWFGPWVEALSAKDFEEAIKIANCTQFGLTGAVFSKNRDHLELARREVQVGNLYFNRKCTGALVDVHPFGGFNMSGTDSKAGGRDYLPLFLQVKLVSEFI